MDYSSPYAILGYCASIIAAAIIGSIKILTNCTLKKQNSQQRHEIGMASRFENHEIALATRFENIANNFKEYASSERADRKEANKQVMEIHKDTITAVSEMKEAVSGMRVALDNNTKMIEKGK